MCPFQSYQDELTSLDPQVEYIKHFVQSLVTDAPDGTETASVTSDLDDIVEAKDNLSHEIDEVLTEMETASEYVSDFQRELQQAGVAIAELEEEIDTKGPVGRDLDIISTQIDELNVFNQKLAEEEEMLGSLDQQCEGLIEHGYIPESDPLRGQTTALQKQYNRVIDKAEQRRDAVNTVAGKLEALDADLRQADANMDELIDELARQKPVAGEVHAIKEEQEEFKVGLFCDMILFE